MKKLNEYLKMIVNNRKKMFALSGILGFFAIVILGIGVTLALPSDTTPPYLKDQVSNGLSFEDATLTYEQGVTTYTVKVYNDRNTASRLKTIAIVFKDVKGSEITRLTGYIGTSLDAETSRILSVKTDIEIPNINSIMYVVQR